MRKLGLYTGARNLNETRRIESWLGNELFHVEDFFAGDSWDTIKSPTWWLDGWDGTGYDIEFSVPMLPNSGAALIAGANGQYNGYWQDLAGLLIDRGYGACTLRIGWEFNGRWFKWYAGTDPGAFVLYWRQIVDAIREVPGSGFLKFDWCPTLGKANMNNVEDAYPGDEYVDYIGTDVYDQSWIPDYNSADSRWQDMMMQPFGLAWHARFAKAHGKRLTFPEWGLCIRQDGHGGGDTPSFIRRMYHWIRTHDTAHADYFYFDAPDGKHRLENFPVSKVEFKRLFGA